MNIQNHVLGMILKGYPRISESFISNEIRLLEDMGFTIHIFSMRKPREAFTHASIKQIRAKVTYLPSTLFTGLPLFLVPNLKTAWNHPREYSQALHLVWRRFKRTKKIATLKHLLQAGYLVNAMKGQDVRHLHAHFAHSPTSVAMFASILSALPFSFTAHAKDIYTSDTRQLTEKMDRASFVITCTRYNLAYLKNLASTGKPLHAVYHGIDLKLFAPPVRPVQPTVPYTLLTVARFVKKKGLPTILNALCLLRDRGISFRYVLIGDGEEKAALQKQITDMGLAAYVVMPGTLPHEKVLEHYSAADLFVLACRVAQNGDRDGVPNVLVESLAMGVPVVATHISALPELITHEISGLLVPPEDPDTLAAAMLRMLTDIPLRRQVIREGRKKVVEDFDNRERIRELGEIYLKYAGRTAGACSRTRAVQGSFAHASDPLLSTRK